MQRKESFVMTTYPRPASHDRDERGASLVMVLAFSFFISLLATSLLFITDVEFKTSTNHSDSQAALNDLDSAIAEATWRMNLHPGASAPPTGSRISVNSLSNYDASLPVDPWSLLRNFRDDDGDGVEDDPDELNFNR